MGSVIFQRSEVTQSYFPIHETSSAVTTPRNGTVSQSGPSIDQWKTTSGMQNIVISCSPLRHSARLIEASETSYAADTCIYGDSVRNTPR